MNVSNKTYIRQLVIGLVIFVLFGLSGSIITLAQGVDVDRLMLSEGWMYKPGRVILMAEIEIHEIGFDMLSYLKTLDPVYYDNLIEDMDDFEMCIKGYEEIVTDSEKKENVAKVKKIYLELKPLVFEIINLNQAYYNLQRRFIQKVNKLDDFIDEEIEFDLYSRPHDPELKKLVRAMNGIECENQQFAWRLICFLETGNQSEEKMARDNFKQLEYFVDELRKVATSLKEKKWAYVTEIMVLELKKVSVDLVAKKGELWKKLGLFKSKIDSIDKIIDQDIQKDIYR